MWSLSNSTPYKAERGWVRDMDGREVWLVAVRARYLIDAAGALHLAERDEQPDVKLAPEYAGEGLDMVLVADSDLPHQKLATDLIVHGHAHAPEGSVAERLHVSMQVGSLRKDLVVWGDRVWQRTGLSAPQPFIRMPLSYRNAYGGVDPADPANWYAPNPAGKGFSANPLALTGQPAPNVELPQALVSARTDRPEPAGLAPVPGHWPQRRRYGGTYDAAWEQERLPLLPLDFDPRFHQQAPPDQQVPGFLHGGEPVLLEGMHPRGRLRFDLPRVSLVFETEFDDLTRMKHEARLHTVLFEPDLPAVSLVWHTHLECHSRVTLLRTTRIWERRRVTGELR